MRSGSRVAIDRFAVPDDAAAGNSPDHDARYTAISHYWKLEDWSRFEAVGYYYSTYPKSILYFPKFLFFDTGSTQLPVA
jgi:hypothetical protein